MKTCEHDDERICMGDDEYCNMCAICKCAFIQEDGDDVK